jgi:hypothetical protein
MNKALLLARRISAQTHAAVVLIHHSGKKGMGERGSSALRADVDASIRLHAHGSQVVLTEEKMRDAAALPRLTLERLSTGESAVLVDAQNAGPSSHVGTLTSNDKKILGFLSDGTPRTFTGLLASGVPRTSLDACLKRLAQRGLVLRDVSSGKPRYRIIVEGKGQACAAVHDLPPSEPFTSSGSVPSSTTTLKGGTVGPPGGNAETATTFLPPRTTQAPKEVAQEPSEIGAAA